ncbi:MAG TPA: aminotransferase class V-fold PLP-dependent enzyme, partial [Terriglobales bacterium]|nr:aminotransferase class V-fold PLP-dependent enzyme [Terriglobales bacterium]
MSTNITSTNNGASNGASRPKSTASAKSSALTGEGARHYPFGTIPLPDPATLERLANEFFRAMPHDLANGDVTEAPPEAESEEIPVTMFEEPLPPGGTSGVESAPNAPASLPYTQPGPLTEADLRAIAASLAGSTALVPGAPGTAPTPPVPGSPPGFLAESELPPMAMAPTLPPATELFSFPGVATMPFSPTSPPAGADASAVPQSPGSVPTFPGSTPYFVEGEKGTSPAAAPLLPPISELFSFPRVPSMPNVPGIQTVPNPPAPPASPSAAPPSAADGTAVPPQVHDVKGITPQVPGVATPEPASPPTSSATGERAAYPGDVTSLPSLSELFSFPGVPGVQSVPGTPSPPSPGVPSTESDLRKTIPPPAAPGSGNLAGPAVTAPGTETQKTAGAATSPSGIEAFEFRPDLEPAELGIAKRPLDAKLIRRDFPILEERVHGRPLVWLDNAATTQKPQAVIDRLAQFYAHENSNIHR